VLERRQQLEAKERNLRMPVIAQPREQLRAKLQAVAPDTTGTDARLRELAQRRTTATAERDTYARREADLKRNPTAAQATTAAGVAEAVEVEEKLITKDEELRAIANRTAATEYEADLVRLGRCCAPTRRRAKSWGSTPRCGASSACRRGRMTTRTR